MIVLLFCEKGDDTISLPAVAGYRKILKQGGRDEAAPVSVPIGKSGRSVECVYVYR